MKKLLQVFILIAAVSFIAVNFTNAQDNKANAACCVKAKADATAMQKSDCPMKGSATAMNQSKTNCPKDCPMAAKKDCPMAGTKNCPMAGTKDCPKTDCPMKAGTVANGKPCCAKSGAIAETKTK